MMDFPDLYTPAQAAAKLNLFNNGEPNSRLLKRLAKDGELEYIEISKNNMLFSKESLLNFLKEKTCRDDKRIKESMSNTDQTASVGKLSNGSEADVSGTQLAFAALRKRKKDLQKSSSKEKAQSRTPKKLHLVK